MSEILQFLEILIISVTVLIAVFAVLLVVVMRGPESPLKSVLSGLLIRLGVSVGFVAVGLPIQVVPIVDVGYDTIGTILLILFWLKFFVDTFNQLTTSRDANRSTIDFIDHHRP
jgi:hypothetical protein